MLIINYDEHGGSYDHVPPPIAVPPDEKPTQPFRFNRYGVRIPNVFISPWIKPGTILRVVEENELPHNGPPYPFDHTSIITTIRKCFNLKDKPLTNRVAVAPDFGGVLNLKKPENNPPLIKTRATKAKKDELNTLLDAPMNSFQKALHELAAYLPENKDHKSNHDTKYIEQYIEDIRQKKIKPEIPDHKTPREAISFIKNKVKNFLGNT